MGRFLMIAGLPYLFAWSFNRFGVGDVGAPEIERPDKTRSSSSAQMPAIYRGYGRIVDARCCVVTAHKNGYALMTRARELGGVGRVSQSEVVAECGG